MARGRRLAEWDRTASLLAMMFNSSRDPKKTDPATPRTFHPYRPKQEPSTHLGRMTMREVYEVMFGGKPIPTRGR